MTLSKCGSRAMCPKINPACAKVYNVYKKMEEAGRDLILPPPPQALDPDFRGNEEGALEAPNVMRGHGVNPLEPDFHKVEDKARLLARVELDKEIEEMHRYNYLYNFILSCLGKV